MADNKVAAQSIKTEMNAYTTELLKNSMDCGNTPTLTQMEKLLQQKQKELEQVYKDQFSVVEFNEMHYQVSVFTDNILIPAYKSNLSLLPRTVNGLMPFAVTTEMKEKDSKVMDALKSTLQKSMQELCQKSISTGNTPNRDQVSAYLDGQISTTIAADDTLTDNDKQYIKNKLASMTKLLLSAYDDSLKNFPRKINNKFPWTPVDAPDPTSPTITGKNGSNITATNINNTVTQSAGLGMNASTYTFTNNSFSGCDMVATVQVTLPDNQIATKVIGSLQTITYSVFMDKRPVRAIGNINAKDYVLGPRTIAGSLIFAVFDKHWAYDLMNDYRAAGGLGSMHFLVDELPPFNLTLSFANEYGSAARLALYGVRIVNEGQTMSVNDIFTENTYQFVASDIDYLTECTGFSDKNNNRQTAPPVIITTLPVKSDSVKITPIPVSTNGSGTGDQTVTTYNMVASKNAVTIERVS